MRILLAAKHPPGGKLAVGGVQTWIATVAAEMEQRGHLVTIWGPEFDLPGDTFDLGILANLADTGPAAALCDRVLRISHGIIEAERGGPGFLATSEEVAEHWGCDAGIVRQPIDLDFWHPGDEGRRNWLTRISYRGGLPYLPVSALLLHLKFEQHKKANPERVRVALRRSACVIATGRAAVEAMACGAPVVICDDREYQGPLLDLDPVDAMLRNYSGRGGVKPNSRLISKAIGDAIERGSLRDHAENFHDVKKIVDQLLES